MKNKRYLREINIIILSENAYSIVASSSSVSPKGLAIRLPKHKDKNGMYVMFRCRKIYEANWITR